MENKMKGALLNSGIAAGLVFFGAFVGGQISWTALVAALAAAGVTFFTNLREEIVAEGKKVQTSLKVLHFI